MNALWRYLPSLWLVAVSIAVAAFPLARTVTATVVYTLGLAVALALHGAAKYEDWQHCEWRCRGEPPP